MAVRMMSKNPDWVYIDEDEVVFAPEEMIQITPRKQPPINRTSHWLALAKKTTSAVSQKRRNLDWCKILPLTAIITSFAICGLVYGLRDDMDTESNFIMTLIMMVLGSILSVWLLCILATKFRRMYSSDIKVRKVFNENNADDYIDIDY